jgi:hypothetical protein
MRYMVLLKGDPILGAGGDTGFLEAMHAYEDDLGKAGVMLASQALRSNRTSTHIRFDSGGVRSVRSGPPGAAGEVLAAFVLIQVRSKEEAIEWARRCPLDRALAEGDEADIEIREVADEPPW